MFEMFTRRRALRAGGTALAVGLTGCLGGRSDQPRDATGERDGRPTVTPGDPRTLDVSGSWPQVGSGAGHDGHADAAGSPESGAVYWHRRRVRSGPPVLVNGTLFHYATVGEETSGQPTVTRTREPDAGTAHPVYGQPALVARDASDGTIEWTTPTAGESRSWPAAAGDRVVSAVPGAVAAHDAESGEVLWTVGLDERSPGAPVIVDDVAVVPVQGVVDGDEYVHRPAVRALSLVDGDERWSVEPPHRSNRLAAADGTLVVVSDRYGDSGTLLGFEVADGAERWRRRVEGDFFDRPVVASGTVYVTDSGEAIRALGLADGAERWSVAVGDEPGTLATDGERVYAAVGDDVLALDAGDASREWRVSPAEGAETAVAVAAGRERVYAGFQGEEAGVYALGRGDGTEHWHHRFPWQVVEGDMVTSGVRAQPVVADGAVYVPAVDGLYAFGPG